MPHVSVSQSPPDSWAARVAGKSRPVELEEHVPVLVAVRSPSRAGKRVSYMRIHHLNLWSVCPSISCWSSIDNVVDLPLFKVQSMSSSFHPDSVYWQDLDGWVDVTELENAEGT